MPALSIATSVPVPMAMPTSAAASAGASLTPSPAIATTRPSRLQLFDHRALAVGQHLGLDLVDAELSRHRLAVVRLSPVSMTMAMPSAFSACQRLRGAFLHRIGDGDDAGELAVDGDEDRGRAFAAQPLGVVLRAIASRCRARRRNRALPSTTRRRSTMPIAPLPARRIEAAHRRKLDLALGRRLDDGAGRADAR